MFIGNSFKVEILCVTKKSANSALAKWHRDISGIAEIGTTIENAPINTRSKVCFNGEVGDLLYIRSGLSGSVVVFGVSMMTMGDDYEIWELYSIIPTSGHWEAEVRRNAEKEIKANRKPLS